MHANAPASTYARTTPPASPPRAGADFATSSRAPAENAARTARTERTGRSPPPRRSSPREREPAPERARAARGDRGADIRKGASHIQSTPIRRKGAYGASAREIAFGITSIVDA